MGDIPLDLDQSPTNINFTFNVRLDGRWTSNGHLTVGFSVRWVGTLASAIASITPSNATTTPAFKSAFDKYPRPVYGLRLRATFKLEHPGAALGHSENARGVGVIALICVSA